MRCRFFQYEFSDNNLASTIKIIKNAILLKAALSISGCASYHLRTIPALPFNDLIFVSGEAEKQKHISPAIITSKTKNNSWQYFLMDAIKNPRVQVVESNYTLSPKWYLAIISDNEQKQIASLSSDGTVREYRLFKRIKVQLRHEAKLFDVINIEASKDLPYNELQRSAKELEEQKLWSDINMEIAERLETTLSWQVKNNLK